LHIFGRRAGFSCFARTDAQLAAVCPSGVSCCLSQNHKGAHHIRIVQELLGYRDVATTMIAAHVSMSRRRHSGVSNAARSSARRLAAGCATPVMPGLEGKIAEAITYYQDEHTLAAKCDFVMANPPFNVDLVDAERIKTDPRLPLRGDRGVGAVSYVRDNPPSGDYRENRVRT
jgi:hypothetical protein